MSSLEHTFETGSEAAGEPAALDSARGGWWNGLSLRGKLGLAVFGNTIVLALIAYLFKRNGYL